MYREVSPPYWFLVNVFADNFCLKTSDFHFFSLSFLYETIMNISAKGN